MSFLTAAGSELAFNVDRIAASLGTLLKVYPGLKDGVEILIKNLALSELTDDERQVIFVEMDRICQVLAKYLTKHGRMEVRYLGDLKPSEYQLNAQFFAIGRDGINASVLDALDLVRQMARGKFGSFWINLSAVRDIKTSLRANEEFPGLPIEADFGYLMEVGNAVATWQDNNRQLQLKDEA